MKSGGWMDNGKGNDSLHYNERTTEMTDTAAKLDPFANLDALRLNQDYLANAGVKKLLTTVPVRKPNKQVYVRTHPDHRMTVALIELRDDREIYLVTPPMVAELPGEYFPAILFLTISRQGVLFLWPVRLPGPDGKQLDWHRSALEAAELARSKWIRVCPNMALGAYEIFESENVNIPEPQWPAPPFDEVLRIAFRDRLIDSVEHPVVKLLRGQI
jgi:hypothetical protein